MANFSQIIGHDFNAEEVVSSAGETEYGLIPAGWYNTLVESFEEKATATGVKRLALRLSIIGEQYNGRKLFVSFNVQHSNPVVVEIANRDLGKLCVACGKPKAQDTDELLNCTCWVKVCIRPAKGEYAESNEVKDYRADAPKATPATPAPSSPSAPSAKRVMPWEKK